MILEDFIIKNEVGLFCKYGNFYLDPQQPVPLAIISHAHADHAVRGNKVVYCTSATAEFMKHRYKKFAADEFNILAYNDEFQVNGVNITFVSAGHILGSAQILMEYNGVKYLYTGDYKLQSDATCEPYTFVKADVLITETTFADPNIKHPDPIDEIKKLNAERINIMLGAYALGKSQNIIRLINDHCFGKNILLHHSIYPFAKIYENFGVDLGKYSIYDRKVMKNNPEGNVYIVPPMVFNSYHKAINVKKAFASGWSRLQQGNEIELYISDHGDWLDLLKIIQNTNPQQIWTLHGDGKPLQNYLKQKIEVKILN